MWAEHGDFLLKSIQYGEGKKEVTLHWRNLANTTAVNGSNRTTVVTDNVDSTYTDVWWK